MPLNAATNYNYFRDYDPGIGRYVQSDPIGLLGGLNTFGYVYGSPLNRVDVYGLFAGDNHSMITKEALGNDNCVDVDDLAMRTQNKDYEPGSQSPENAYRHAMRNGVTGESIADARRKYNAFVDSELSKCTLDGFANALHDVQDSAASGHKDFPQWFGGLPSASHLKGDFVPEDAEWQDAVQKTKQLMDRYKRRCGCACKLAK